MAGSQPFDPSQLLTLVSGSRPNYLRLGGGSLCNAYLFDGSEADLLTLGAPFTGNLKVIIIAASETGVNPAIVAGRQGVFVASTDPLIDMQQNQYEIDTVSFAGPIVDNTFTGRVAYAKDDVWYDIDMGAPELRWYYDFDGIDDYITIPQVDLVAGDTVEIKFVAPSVYNTSIEVIACNAENSNAFKPYIDTTGNLTNLNAFNYDTFVDDVIIADGHPMPTDGEMHTVRFDFKSTQNLSFIGATPSGSATIEFPIYDADIQAVSGNRFYAINDGPGATEILDSISGENGTPNNFNDPRWYEGV
jgi:hypothetical protein